MFIEKFVIFVILEIFAVVVILFSVLMYKSRSLRVLIALLKHHRREQLHREQANQLEIRKLRENNKQLTIDLSNKPTVSRELPQSEKDKLKHILDNVMNDLAEFPTHSDSPTLDAQFLTLRQSFLKLEYAIEQGKPISDTLMQEFLEEISLLTGANTSKPSTLETPHPKVSQHVLTDLQNELESAKEQLENLEQFRDFYYDLQSKNTDLEEELNKLRTIEDVDIDEQSDDIEALKENLEQQKMEQFDIQEQITDINDEIEKLGDNDSGFEQIDLLEQKTQLQQMLISSNDICQTTLEQLVESKPTVNSEEAAKQNEDVLQQAIKSLEADKEALELQLQDSQIAEMTDEDEKVQKIRRQQDEINGFKKTIQTQQAQLNKAEHSMLAYIENDVNSQD
jgi:hypothetical protein